MKLWFHVPFFGCLSWPKVGRNRAEKYMGRGGGWVVWRERERGMGKEGDRKDEEVRKKMTE